MSIRHGLLALLAQGPRYGYQLRAEFEASTGATWPLNIGQVYSTLRTLQDLIRLKNEQGPQAADPGGRAWPLVLESMIFQAEAEVRWLDHCEASLACAAGSTAGEPSGLPGG
jgi:hypothetical protein